MTIKKYNVNPYYDDFDQTKNFYRILFKPGVAVQARELTQLQTILQNQISTFGSHVFEEGSIVIPGQSAVTQRYAYVKLETTYNDTTADSILSSLVGETLSGETTGVQAKVINQVASTDTDEPTLYVEYTGEGGQSARVFADGEVLKNSSGSLKVKAIASDATGYGSAFIIEPGVIFTKGTFVSFVKQTLILSKYSEVSDAIVGFDVSEETITSQDDGSLLDPAQGSYNFSAPGADRYQVSLTLSSRASSTAEPNDFIQLLRIEAGEVSFKADNPDYAYLEDTLARRTYDESGNYTVRPYGIALNEHLKNDVFTNGIYSAARGGDEAKILARVSPGKSYVRGYEVENLSTRNIELDKGRDVKEVNSGFVRTNAPDFVSITNLFNIPNFDELVTVTLRDEFTATPGSAAGAVVGTARVRGLDYSSGTHGTDAIYKMYLFDIQMEEGKTFERNVKQITDGTFTSDVNPTAVELSGAASGTSGASIITGNGTRFSSELLSGDVISVDGNNYLVNNVSNNNEITILGTLSSTFDNVFASRLDTAYVKGNSSLIYRFGHDAISTHSDEVYKSRKIIEGTLSSGTDSISADTDEVFTSETAENYFLVITSGGSTGTVVDMAGTITLGGTPSGKTLSFDISSTINSNDTYALYATVSKTNSASNAKTKTLVENATVNLTSEAASQARKISLGKADAYRIVKIEYSNDGFGQPFNASDVTDITNDYDFYNGQTTYFYGISYVKRKASGQIPAGPVRVTFDYFSHGPGDYFSRKSYDGQVEYSQIPKVSINNETYNLARCLDFRPRIDDAGTSFVGSGGSTTEMLDFNDDFLLDYEYYLGRIDKMYINSEGEILVKKGEPADIPLEPSVPSDGMAIFTLKIPPYTYSVNDINLTTVDNRRYTMRDIGAFESRIRNLEYYTSLSLLEKETASLQIKDDLGFDRFKNGFVVDQFSGHKVGDPTRADYAVAIDQTKLEARPLTATAPIALKEKITTDSARTTAGYQKTGKFATLPYNETPYITNEKASRTENVNPYGVVTYNGNMSLSPNKDSWFDTEQLPAISVDNTNDLSSLTDTSAIQDKFDTVFGSWRTVWFGDLVESGIVNPNIENVDGSNNILGVTDSGLTEEERLFLARNVSSSPELTIDGNVARTNVIAPFMRSKVITVTARGMKPNTRVYPFFDGFRVDSMCTLSENTAVDRTDNQQIASEVINNSANVLYTDAGGSITFTFNYNAAALPLSTGTKTFKLTDSQNNIDDEATTLSQTTFISTGEYIVQAEINTSGNTEPDPEQPSNPDPVAEADSITELSDTTLSYSVNATNQLKNSFTFETWVFGNGITPDGNGGGYEVGDRHSPTGGTVIPGGQAMVWEVTNIAGGGIVNGAKLIEEGEYVEGSLPTSGTFTFVSGSNNGSGASFSDATFKVAGTYVDSSDVDYSYQNVQFRNVGADGSILHINKSNITDTSDDDIDVDIILGEQDVESLNLGVAEISSIQIGVRKHSVGTSTVVVTIPTSHDTVTITLTVEGVQSGAVVDPPETALDDYTPTEWIGVATSDVSQIGLVASVYNHLWGRNPDIFEMEHGIATCADLGVTQTTISNAVLSLGSTPENWRTVNLDTLNAEALALFEAIHAIANRGYSTFENSGLDAAGGLITLMYSDTSVGFDFFGNSTFEDAEASILAASQQYLYYLITHDGSLNSDYDHEWPKGVKNNSIATYYGLLIGDNLEQCPARPHGSSINYVDPLAQSFIIDKPTHLTSVVLYFGSKDESAPVEIQIRRMINGFPASITNGGDVHIEGSLVSLDPNSIILSSDGSFPTSFVFDNPIYLEPDEYCIVVQSPNSTDYTVFVSEVGQVDLSTNTLIDKQPLTGSLFKSQNASTWTAVQTQDLKMTINRAEFTATTGTVDLVPEIVQTYYQADINPFELFNGSDIMRVYHRNHGLPNGSTVKFRGLTDGTYYGIDSDAINSGYINVSSGSIVENTFTISNVTIDSYTVTLPSSATVPTGKVRFGGNNVLAVASTQYDIFRGRVLIANDNPNNVTHSIRTANTGYSLASAFRTIESGQDTIMTETQQLADVTNKAISLPNDDSFTYRVVMTTNDTRTSPMVSLDKNENVGIFVRNRMNDPDPTDALSVETITVADSNQIEFDADGKISFANSTDRALVARVVEGTTIDVSYASGVINPDNEGSYRVREVAEDGSYLYVSGALIGQEDGTDVTITNDSGFVAEQAPEGGSAISKYITRKINFVNPSTSLNLRIATSKPSGSDIEFYYKTQNVGEEISIDNKEFVKMNVTVPVASAEGFIDVEHLEDNLPEFTSVIFKIVFKGSESNTAATPRVKDLRLLALA